MIANSMPQAAFSRPGLEAKNIHEKIWWVKSLSSLETKFMRVSTVY